jgi:hypothetical protein
MKYRRPDTVRATVNSPEQIVCRRRHKEQLAKAGPGPYWPQTVHQPCPCDRAACHPCAHGIVRPDASASQTICGSNQIDNDPRCLSEKL